MANFKIHNHYVRLYGLEEGLLSSKKPKLVFLHGLLGNSQNWASIANQFEDDFDVLTYDLRGHGRTGVFDGKGYALEVLARDLIGILDGLSWDKVSAVGHSLGGRILINAVSIYSDRFDKVVIEDMGPHKTNDSSSKTAAMINSVPVPFENRQLAKTFFKEVFEVSYGKNLSDYLYGNLTKDSNGFMNWRFDKEGALKCLKIGQEMDFWAQYKSIDNKHLIIRGEYSEHLPKQVMLEMQSSNSKAQTVEISKAGHWVHFDQRAHFVKELSNFLQN